MLEPNSSHYSPANLSKQHKHLNSISPFLSVHTTSALGIYSKLLGMQRAFRDAVTASGLESSKLFMKHYKKNLQRDRKFPEDLLHVWQVTFNQSRLTFFHQFFIVHIMPSSCKMTFKVWENKYLMNNVLNILQFCRTMQIHTVSAIDSPNVQWMQ